VGATVEDVGFDKTTTDGGFESLKNAAREVAPDLGQFEVKDHWAGLRPFAYDSFPILGELPGYENGFVATAHYRNGILLAPKTAEIMAELILDGVESPYIRMFGMNRMEIAGAMSVP
jgi:glycine/D-amino acid oxidase-like deaminating enzyme